MSQPLEAQVIDARHLKLKQPIEIPPGSMVIVTITPAEEKSWVREWHQISAQGLAAAYGEDEPDYPLDLVKTPNPDYEA